MMNGLEWYVFTLLVRYNFKLHFVAYEKDTKKNKVKIMRENKITTFVDDNKGWIDFMASEGIETIHWA